jgi:hypothetical protein
MPAMLKVGLKFSILAMILNASLYAFTQFATVYFYVWESQDLVKDEVKFAPARESASEDHLVSHIVEMAQYHNIKLDPKGIKIKKKVTIPGMTWMTLAVDVSYSAPVDLTFYRQPLHFHTTASVVY